MTKENRERLYKDSRDTEKNYEARDGLNSGPTATSVVRKRAKERADAILAKHPELEAPVETETPAEEPKEEPVEEEVKEEKEVKPKKTKKSSKED